jgi:Ser/Thr protein kinase RdoA (MazF antagonist)
MADPPGPQVWSEELAVELGRRALVSLGLGSATMTLLRFGGIATFRVEDPPRFLKVADPGFRSAEPVLERSLQLSAWLDREGFPVAGAAEEGSARPLAVDAAWAGLWNWEEQQDVRPDPGPTGELLRRLHDLLADCPVPLPELDQFDAARRHTEALSLKGHLDEESVEFLLGRARRMGEDWNAFQSELGVGAIHGDFEVDNVLMTGRGPVLVDLDNAQTGPREWDLVKAAPGSAGGWREEEWPAFAAGYDYDVLTAPGAEVLREVRHLRSLVWLLGDPQYADRFARGRRLLDQWIRSPEKRCFELDWLEAGGRG